MVTLSLILILAVCLGVAFNPVYISGGHGSGYRFSLLGFIDILGQFRIPAAVSLGYFICLTLLLAGLLVYQHTPQRFPALPLSREQRRRLLRRSMLGGLAEADYEIYRFMMKSSGVNYKSRSAMDWMHSAGNCSSPRTPARKG